jgi:hypothetical protein
VGGADLGSVYYRLTPAGAERLGAEVDRLRVHTAVAARRLNLAGGNSMSESAELEGRYRRLLALYPTEHRSVHEDEMLSGPAARAAR